MYARKVSLSLKSESAPQSLNKVEHEVIPLFRKQKGYLDELVVLSDDKKMLYLYTFWDNSKDAEQFDRTALPVLTSLLTEVADGALRVDAFRGPRNFLWHPAEALLRSLTCTPKSDPDKD